MREVASDVLLDLLMKSDSRLLILGRLVDRAKLYRGDSTVVALAYLAAREAKRLGYSAEVYGDVVAAAWSRVWGEPDDDEGDLRG